MVAPAAWSSCSANVRCAGVGLKSYLSSGKSSAMAISFREMPFHCPRTSCDGPFLGAPFLAISCARLGTTANPIARDRPKIHCPFFIIFSLHSRADGPASISSTATPAAPCPRRGSTPRAASSALPSVPRSLMQSQLGAPADSRNDRHWMCSRVVGHVRFVRLSGKWTISEYGVIRGSCLRTGRSIRAQANPRIVEIAETRRGFPDHPFGKNVDSVHPLTRAYFPTHDLPPPPQTV